MENVNQMTFDDLEVGQLFVSPGRTVTEADVVAFAGLSGDYNPVHTDAHFMKNHPLGRRVAHGLLGAAFASGLAARVGVFDGMTIALLETSFKYVAPVRIQDTVHLEMEITNKRRSSKNDRGVVTTARRLINQDGAVVIDSTWVTLVATKKRSTDP